jgi:UDP-glucose 4-epimerase
VRALVTGGAGFIGSHLVDSLLAEGIDVLAVDDLSRGRREQVNTAAEFTRMDVADPRLIDLVGAHRPEIVFHLAAQIDVRRSVADPVADTQTNVVGIVNLLHASAQHRVRRVVFASSGGAIYGDTDVIPTPESHELRPASPYGAAKLCGEAYGALYQRMRGLEFIALRYANVYGPRQDPHGEAGVVAIFAQRLLRDAAVTINGDGLQTRDYVYVDDVVRANLAAMSSRTPDAVNIGTGVETDVDGLYERLRRISGTEARAVHGDAKPGEQRRSCLDIGHARTALGWEPSVALDEGLRRTTDFFRNV